MRKKFPLFFLFILGSILSFASPNKLEFLNDAAIVAKVESYNYSGFLNCEFQCFLDMNYARFESEPILYFQIGSPENPSAYFSNRLDYKYLKTLAVEKVFNDDNYKLKINFGKIKVQHDFVASIIIIENGEAKTIHLIPTNFQDQITKMRAIEDTDLCKADLFLKKINFETLYKNMSHL